MTLKTRILISLVGLSIVDAVIPIPIVGLILIFVQGGQIFPLDKPFNV